MNSLMHFVRTGDVEVIERYYMDDLRAEAGYRTTDVGMSAFDETNYVTYWMASHRDHDVAYEMIKLFDTAVGRDPHVWSVFALATYMAARVRKNQKILNFLPPVQLLRLYDTDLL